MECKFFVGQKVVCIDVRPKNGHWGDDEAPILGAVYTITSIHPNYKGDITLRFKEIERDKSAIQAYGPSVGYGFFRFKPLVEKKTGISVFKDMLNKSPRHAQQNLARLQKQKEPV